MTIVRWQPFREMVNAQDRVRRMLGADWAGQENADDVMSRGAWLPPVDIYSNGDHELVIKAELPDVNRDEIDVTVENSTLTIRGEKKMDSSVKEEHLHRVERSYGAFTRSFSLPATVDPTKVAADYKDGVLTVKLPLRDEAKPKQIRVAVAS